VVALMMLDEIFLTIEYAIAAVHYARPILSSLMHPHLMFLPVRLGFECLLSLLFSAIRAKHVWFTRLTLRLVVIREEGGRRNTNIIGWRVAWFGF
jgi:hypothetical protein